MGLAKYYKFITPLMAVMLGCEGRESELTERKYIIDLLAKVGARIKITTTLRNFDTQETAESMLCKNLDLRGYLMSGQVTFVDDSPPVDSLLTTGMKEFQVGVGSIEKPLAQQLISKQWDTKLLPKRPRTIPPNLTYPNVLFGDSDWAFERDTQKAIEESRAMTQSMSIDNKQKVDKETIAFAPPVFLISSSYSSSSSSLSNLDEEEQRIKEFCQSSKDFYNQLAILSSSPTVKIKEVKEKIDTTIFDIAVSKPESYKQYLDACLQTLPATIILLFTQYQKIYEYCCSIFLPANIVKYSVMPTIMAAETAKGKLNLLFEYAQQTPDDKDGNIKKCLIIIEELKKNLNSHINSLLEMSLGIVAEHKSESPIKAGDNSQQFFNTRIPPHTSSAPSPEAPTTGLPSTPHQKKQNRKKKKIKLDVDKSGESPFPS